MELGDSGDEENRMLAQRLNSAPDGIPKANSNLWKIQRNEVIAVLAHNIVAGNFPVRNLH